MMNVRINILQFLLFSSFSPFLLSCDLIAPSDRFFNENAQPPKVEPLDISEIKPGQHLAGKVLFNVNLESVNSPIARVDLFVDSTLVFSAFNPPYTLELDTEVWSEGEHLIAVGVIETRPNIGLLAVVDFPSLIFSANVVFDQTPPTAVTLQSVIWENGHPRLSWTKNNNLNFYAYIISKDANFGPFPPPLDGAGIDTIYDSSTTTYLDTSTSQFYEISSDYQVNVSNRAEVAPSNIINIRFGETIAVNGDQIARPIISPIREEVYFLESYPSNTLKAVSTVSNTVVRSRQFNFPFPKTFALSKDGSKLFIVSFNSDSLSVIDPTTFNIIMTASSSVRGASSMVIGRPNRLYMTTIIQTGGWVKIIDTNTGAEIGEILIDATDGILTISPDNNTLYVARETSVYKVDVSTDNAQVISQQTASHNVRSLQLSSDGTKIYLGHVFGPPSNFVDIWDSETLTSIGRVTAPEQLFDFFVTSTHIYLSESRDLPEGRYFLPGRVVQYNIESLNPQKFWEFVIVPRMIVTAGNSQFLYARGVEPWVVVPLN